MTASGTALRLDEAVELGHALVQSVAAALNVRALLIKGPVLTQQELRTSRVSSDVDVLVDPANLSQLCEALGRAGWTERATSLVNQRATLHSQTLTREGWPCDIDVHGYFPGFMANPQTVFEALWARRVSAIFARQECTVTDRCGSILILALHSMSGTRTQERHANELEEVARVLLSSREKVALGQLAFATGCAATLAEVLPLMGVPVAPQTSRDSGELRSWRRRVDSGSYGAYLWLRAFRHSSGRERLRLARDVVWPSERDLLNAHPELSGGRWLKLRGRLKRWLRGVRSLPPTARAIWKNRR